MRHPYSTATEDKFYFEEITILVPPNWSQGDYGRTKTETYEKVRMLLLYPTATDEASWQYFSDSIAFNC